MKVLSGNLIAKNLKMAIVVGRFNEFIGKKLLEGAKDCLVRHEVNNENITIMWVPGAYEIPLAAKMLAKTKKYDAIICLGAIIRGATPHFDFVANEVSKGVANISLAEELPIIFGVLTTDTIEQAIERSGTKSGNKGFDAAMTAIEMVNVCLQISK